MRNIIILGALGALLGGCAGVYDQDAWASADARQQLALAQCRAQINDKTFGSVSQYIECELAAERTMAKEVKLARMDVFEFYAARMRLTAKQADARQITPEEMTAQFKQAHVDFEGQISQAVANDAQKRAQIAAALAGMAEGAQREADRQAYIQANQPKPFNCTSTRLGSTVNITCQ